VQALAGIAEGSIGVRFSRVTDVASTADKVGELTAAEKLMRQTSHATVTLDNYEVISKLGITYGLCYDRTVS
jgi:hypothetical protein